MIGVQSRIVVFVCTASLAAPPGGRPHIDIDLRTQRAAGQNSLSGHRQGLSSPQTRPLTTNRYPSIKLDQPQRPPFKRAADAVALVWWVQASIGGGASARPVPDLGRFTIRPLGV